MKTIDELLNDLAALSVQKDALERRRLHGQCRMTDREEKRVLDGLIQQTRNEIINLTKGRQ